MSGDYNLNCGPAESNDNFYHILSQPDWALQIVRYTNLEAKLAEAEAENKTLRELLQTEANAAHSFADKRDVAEAECDRLREAQAAMVDGAKDTAQ